MSNGKQSTYKSVFFRRQRNFFSRNRTLRHGNGKDGEEEKGRGQNREKGFHVGHYDWETSSDMMIWVSS